MADLTPEAAAVLNPAGPPILPLDAAALDAYETVAALHMDQAAARLILALIAEIRRLRVDPIRPTVAPARRARA